MPRSLLKSLPQSMLPSTPQPALLSTLRHALQLPAVAALIGFTTCAVAADNGKTLAEKLEKQKYQQGEAIEYINDYELDGWNYIDNTHIVIHTGPSKDYLISVMGNCRDLSTAENIAFTTTTSKLTRFDKLMVRGAGGIVQHCPITQINALTKKKAE